MAHDRLPRRPRDQHVRSFIPGLSVRSKIWLEVNGRFAIGEGGLELLNAISVIGSLAGAAQQVGWSYRHAWGYLRRAENVLGVRLLTTRVGKGAARGATLTPHARRLIRLFEKHSIT
jgi:molybdate transport system regulatory protein